MHRRADASTVGIWADSMLARSWVAPLIGVLAVLGLYAVDPYPSNAAYGALHLSYALPSQTPSEPDGETLYGKGREDLKFVAFYALVFLFGRQFLAQELLRPLAKWFGLARRSKQDRFVEQVYIILYNSASGLLGLYVMSRTPVWYFQTSAMYEDYPHMAHEALFKAYYLLQASFWVQQAAVLLLQLEKPRKDFNVLAAHHAITVLLIWLSYRFHFTYIGVAVFITHDISDVFFALSKTLSYLESSFTQPFFLFFISSWIYLRHYLNLWILYSIATEFRSIGSFELDWATEQYKCWISQAIAFALLAALQLMNLFWLVLILQVGYNVVFYNLDKDVRSDDEGSVVEN